VRNASPDYLTEREVCARFGIPPRTMFDLRRRGEVPPYLRVSPRRIVYPLDGVEAWAKARTLGTTPPGGKNTA
jgi:predicted DNA-binding transcriptional regulator AlpA